MENRIIIIDGNSLINRAYYAMQNPMMTKEGIYTQGIYGFINMLDKIKREYPSEYMAVAFDVKAPTFRHKEYKEYKEGRKKMPPELAMQIPLLKEILSSRGIALVEKEGYEADDIIGTLAVQSEKEGLAPLIITGDKDALQLASDKTAVMITKKGISQFDWYDGNTILEKYGFTAKQFIDYKGLMGDSSDNIPGIPGVGEKTAQKLILEFGSVEELLEDTNKLKGRLKNIVEENAALAHMSKRLATIHTEVPLDIDLGELKLKEQDHDKLVELYIKLEFNSFLKKMGTHMTPEAKEEANQYKDLDAQMHIIKEAVELKKLSGAMSPGAYTVMKLFGSDNHRHLPDIVGAGFMIENNYFYVNLGTDDMITELVKILNKKKPKYVGHGLKQDFYLLMNSGVNHFETSFDTKIAQYVIDTGRSNYDLTTLAQEYFRLNIQDEEEFIAGDGQMSLFDDKVKRYADYGLKWCGLVAQITVLQGKKIHEQELETIFFDVELPLVEVMAHMEWLGFKVDREVLQQIGSEINARVSELTNKIYESAGEKFNIKSPAQLGPILFEKLGLPAGKKTKRGYSTGAEILERIKHEHPIIPQVLEYRTLTKLSGTYLEGLIPLIHTDGKIHAHFNQTITTTGRISSSDPNLQNIPIRQEEGRRIRKAFVPTNDEFILMGADYSQIELRVLAHISDDPLLIEAFNQGLDIHRATASRVLGIPEGEITIEQRSKAKAVNFGVIYGMSAFGLSSELNITRNEADEYINNYFGKHKKVKEYMDAQVAFCKEHGYVKTILGRTRSISEIKASNYMVRQLGERLAMNSPIQGSAADIIKLAMVKVNQALKPYKSQLLLQVHDELIIETYRSEVDNVKKILKESMESAMDLKVDLVVDIHQGENWYELK